MTALAECGKTGGGEKTTKHACGFGEPANITCENLKKGQYEGQCDTGLAAGRLQLSKRQRLTGDGNRPGVGMLDR